MSFSPKFNWWIGLVLKGSMVGIGLIILILSVARAGWETQAINNNDDAPRNNLIEFVAVFGDGTTSVGNYKLPESGMLPNHIFYGVKKIRNYLWLVLSHGPAKIKMDLLLADKSASEAEKLIEKGKYNLAIEAGNDAVDNLKYADTLIKQEIGADAQIKQLHYQIFWAGYTYKEIFDKAKGSFGIDTLKYDKLITRINDWNKTQEKNRYNWDY